MRNILEIMRQRYSSRGDFDAAHRVSESELQQILEAARWAPTAHNMQNFEIVVVDDPASLAAIGAVRTHPSEAFLWENYQQLSSSEQDLLQRKTGLLASMFPPSWRTPVAGLEEPLDADHAFLGTALRHCPLLLIVVYDRRKRAPGSEGDMLSFMSLGCVMPNMWLAAESLGLEVQILSALGAVEIEHKMRLILGLPDHMAIAFSCRLGHSAAAPGRYLRVRRDLETFVHRNRYA